MPIKLELNVKEMLKICSEFHATNEQVGFHLSTINEIKDYKIISPIEQLLYINLKYIALENNCGNSDVTYDHRGKTMVLGLNILPQYKIGKYFVDFLVCFKNKEGKPKNEIIVECDGHKWHERTKEERKKEKERERFLVKKGYKIFRYTGSEIFKDPFAIAEEIFDFLNENVTW